MKILLLGGTGVIGTYLVDMFNEKGINTYVTSRSVRVNFGSIHYIKGNAKDKIFLSTVCNLLQWDCIVDFMSYKTDEFSSCIDILLGSTKQYVFISTARVYGNEESPIKETSPRLLDCSKDEDFLGTDEYSLTKARQENILLLSNKKNWTIVRPCITYGDERLQLGVMEKEEWLYRVVHNRTIVFCEEIATRITTMTNGMDISKLLFNIIGNPKTTGEIYHLTSNYHIIWNDVFGIYSKAIKEITGKEPKIKFVSLDDFLFCRSETLKYQVIYDRVYDRKYDISKESELLDMNNFLSPEEGLKQCIKNFITNKYNFKSINWIYEARKDKLTNERTDLSEIKGIKSKIKYIIERYVK